MNILITGGSRGIGYAIAQHLNQQGHSVWLMARHLDQLQAAKESMPSPSNVRFLVCDITQEEQVKETALQLTKQGIKIEALVLNAGIFRAGKITSATQVDIQAVLNTNLVANQMMAKYFYSLLPKPGGRVVVIGSTSAYGSYPDSAICSIAKWGLRGLVHNLRDECRHDGIGVTLLSPGDTNTTAWAEEPVDTNIFVQPHDIARLVETILTLSPYATVNELIVKPTMGDLHDT